MLVLVVVDRDDQTTRARRRRRRAAVVALEPHARVEGDDQRVREDRVSRLEVLLDRPDVRQRLGPLVARESWRSSRLTRETAANDGNCLPSTAKL